MHRFLYKTASYWSLPLELVAETGRTSPDEGSQISHLTPTAILRTCTSDQIFTDAGEYFAVLEKKMCPKIRPEVYKLKYPNFKCWPLQLVFC